MLNDAVFEAVIFGFTKRIEALEAKIEALSSASPSPSPSPSPAVPAVSSPAVSSPAVSSPAVSSPPAPETTKIPWGTLRSHMVDIFRTGGNKPLTKQEMILNIGCSFLLNGGAIRRWIVGYSEYEGEPCYVLDGGTLYPARMINTMWLR